MPLVATGLVAGAWSVALLPALPPPAWLLAGLPLLPAAWRWPPLRVAAAFAAGLALAVLAAQARLEPGLDAAAAGTDLRLAGRVVGLPEHGGRRDRFRFAVSAARTVDDRAVEVPDTVRLAWYGPERPRVRAGQRWRLTARLDPPRGFRNPGTFDYARWLFREGIGATGYVRDQPPPEPRGRAVAPVDRARAALRDRIEALAAGLRHRGLLLALTVGDRDRIGPAAWETLVATGTNHLVAISGLHVGLLALAGFAAGGLIWRWLGPLHARLPRPVFQALCALALAGAYAGLAGFALPTKRALVMLAAGLGAIVLRRRARPPEAIALAAIAVIALDPLAPMAPGFWLSFGAVGAILYVAAGRLGRPRRIAGWVRLQAAIALALAPLLLVCFGRVSLVAPLANLVAVPWVSAGVVPPALAGAGLAPWWPAAASTAFQVADGILHPLWALLEWAARTPWRSGSAPARRAGSWRWGRPGRRCAWHRAVSRDARPGSSPCCR